MRTLSCIGPQVKSAVTEEIASSGISASEKAELNQFLKTFPTCGTGIPIEVGEVKTGRGKKGERPKRPASPYNLFVKECFTDPDVKRLGNAPEKMKACGKQWREKKNG